MENTFKKLMILGLISLTTNSAFSAAPTEDNYRGVVRGVLSKFDRDYSDLNPQGRPGPGALAIVEKFLSVLNEYKIVGPGEYDLFMPDSSPLASCNVASPTCQETKVLVRESIHQNDSTLFGVQQSFALDIVVWSNSGSGYEKFLEGFYTPVVGTAGKANLTVISCSGCSTIGHSQIEWDGTGVFYHLRSVMYDTRVSNSPDIYAGVVVDATYSPLSGDMKLVIAANNVCDSNSVGDSICSINGTNDHTTGYTAKLHGNTLSGNVYVEGLQGVNNSVIAPSTDAMCIKADGTADLAGVACQNDGIDNFNGMTAYVPNDAPISFITSGSPWPMAEITDTPTF
jgi:hypothetical protein